MYIKKLSLSFYRNIKSADIDFNKNINIFYGDNAQGKTNILESVYMCALGKSHRTRASGELVNFEENDAYISLFISKDRRSEKINIHIKKDDKKNIAVNGVGIRKIGDLLGTLNVVAFSPEDLDIIRSGPAARRKFIDMEICQLSSIYYYNLQQYYKTLKQRNFELKRIQKGISGEDSISLWDVQLLEYGAKIIEQRENFIKKLEYEAEKKHSLISGKKEFLEIKYSPNLKKEDFEEKLKQNLKRDIYLGSTGNGPHKDDIDFLINKKDIKIYGSQGQKRTAALSSKLAEIEIIKEQTNDFPVLLLDDVLSELDEKRQRIIFRYIDEVQILLTCTGIEDSVKRYMDKSSLFYVERGKIVKK